MSNRIYIDSESYSTLQEWTDENLNYTLIDDYYFDKCELILKDTDVKAYAEVKRNGKIRINIKVSNRQMAKCEVVRTPEGENHYQVGFSVADGFPVEEAAKIVELIANIYFMVNGFLFFGNMVENKELTAAGRNDGNDKVIVFRKYKGQFYAVPVNTHRSPEGVFSVRGHLRRYKSGKVVWIDSYFKGLGNENDEKK